MSLRKNLEREKNYIFSFYVATAHLPLGAVAGGLYRWPPVTKQIISFSSSSGVDNCIKVS